jgi:hypothetical protein
LACSGATKAVPAETPARAEPAVAPTASVSSSASTAPSVAAPPPPAPATAPVVRGAIGVRAPTSVVAASPLGDWVSLCQARQDTDGDGKLRVGAIGHGDAVGDQLHQYFVERGGAGTPIDAFVGSDPLGRFVAFVRAGHLVLRDTHAQLETDLSAQGADTRGDLESYSGHRAGSFSPDGTRFAYLRRSGERTLVVIRALSSGEETLVSAGAGNLWRVEFEPEGAFLRMLLVARDTNGDGKLRWPVAEARDDQQTCPLPIPRFVVAHDEPDRVSTLLYRLSDGKLLERSGFVMTLGSQILSRDGDEQLWLESSEGERRLLAPKECHGRVLHAHAPSENVLVGCTGEYGQRRRLYLSTKQKLLRLGYEVAAFESDGRYPDDPRYLVLNPGNESILLDMQSGTTQKLAEGTRYIASVGQTVLVAREQRLYWLAADGSEREVGTRPLFARVLHSGSYVTVGPLWFDGSSASAPVKLASEPLALAHTGRVLLLSEPSKPKGMELVQGPVEWFEPAPAGIAPGDAR